MTPATLAHWLPRVADHIISAQADHHAALAAGDTVAAEDAAADARSLAKLAWAAIRRTKPVHIAKPVMRGPSRNELHIQLYKTPASEHLAMPPPCARPIPR